MQNKMKHPQNKMPNNNADFVNILFATAYDS
jgi:hypothetical protein